MNDPTAGWRGQRRACSSSRWKSSARRWPRKKKMLAEFRAELEREVAKLRAEFLRDRLKAVPPSGSMIA